MIGTNDNPGMRMRMRMRMRITSIPGTSRTKSAAAKQQLSPFLMAERSPCCCCWLLLLFPFLPSVTGAVRAAPVRLPALYTGSNRSWSCPGRRGWADWSAPASKESLVLPRVSLVTARGRGCSCHSLAWEP